MEHRNRVVQYLYCNFLTDFRINQRILRISYISWCFLIYCRVEYSMPDLMTNVYCPSQQSKYCSLSLITQYPRKFKPAEVNRVLFVYCIKTRTARKSPMLNGLPFVLQSSLASLLLTTQKFLFFEICTAQAWTKKNVEIYAAYKEHDGCYLFNWN